MKNRGFSLIELVATLIVIGVVAVVLLPRSNNDTLVATTQAEQLAAAIRYAQSAAMAKGGAGTSGRRYRITFTTTTYQFFYYDIATTTSTGEADPFSGTTAATALTGGASLTIPGTLPSSLVTFNALGAPFTDAAGTTALAANADIVVNYGNASRTVRVFPETGMVRLP